MEVRLSTDTTRSNGRRSVDKPFYMAIAATLLLSALEELYLDRQFTNYFLTLLKWPKWEQSLGLLRLVLELVLLILVLRASFVAHWVLKTIYLIAISIALVTQFSYFETFGRFISPVDFRLVFSSEQSLWKAAIGLFVPTYVFAIPLAYVLFAVLLWKRPNNTRMRGGYGKILFLIGLLSGVSYIPHRLQFTAMTPTGVTSPPSIVHFYRSLARHLSDSVVIVPRQEVLLAAGSPQIRNIVLVIDESIRADHLSLNGYARETTPYLDKLFEAGYIQNSGVALSGATCSPLSNAMLITGTSPSLQVIDDTYRRPTVFQYAKAAGFTTTYIDAQTDVLWNGLTLPDMRHVDLWVRASELGDPMWADYTAAERILDMVRSSSNNFIVLNKRGAHFVYDAYYPPSESVWLPVTPDREYLKKPEGVINSYDNAIRFSVDGFFRKLLPTPEQDLEGTAILYTADHGQTLFDGGVPWMHCNYLPVEAEVPLFVISKNGLPVRQRATHADLLPTINQMLGFSEEIADAQARSIFDLTPMDGPACFMTGMLKVECP